MGYGVENLSLRDPEYVVFRDTVLNLRTLSFRPLHLNLKRQDSKKDRMQVCPIQCFSWNLSKEEFSYKVRLEQAIGRPWPPPWLICFIFSFLLLSLREMYSFCPLPLICYFIDSPTKKRKRSSFQQSNKSQLLVQAA